MPSELIPFRNELYGIAAFVGAIWLVFLASFIFPDLVNYGVIPRTMRGLFGIVCSPLLHANFRHITANTPPLIVLLVLLVGSQARTLQIVVSIVLLGGTLLWVFGRTAIHIGASGLIFGLITYMIVSGFLERRPIPLLIAVLVGFLYGGTLLGGVIPQLNSNVSWDGHLWSAVAGVLVAYLLNATPGPQITPLLGGGSSWPQKIIDVPNVTQPDFSLGQLPCGANF